MKDSEAGGCPRDITSCSRRARSQQGRRARLRLVWCPEFKTSNNNTTKKNHQCKTKKRQVRPCLEITERKKKKTHNSHGTDRKFVRLDKETRKKKKKGAHSNRRRRERKRFAFRPDNSSRFCFPLTEEKTEHGAPRDAEVAFRMFHASNCCVFRGGMKTVQRRLGGRTG